MTIRYLRRCARRKHKSAGSVYEQSYVSGLKPDRGRTFKITGNPDGATSVGLQGDGIAYDVNHPDDTYVVQQFVPAATTQYFTAKVLGPTLRFPLSNVISVEVANLR